MISRTLPFGPTEYIDNGVTVWRDEKEGINSNAWVNHGATVWPLYPDDILATPDVLIRNIANEWNQGQNYRCTGCGVKMSRVDVAGWPLYAGCTCPKCWQAHLDSIERERKAGHICRLCNKPFSLCSC